MKTKTTPCEHCNTPTLNRVDHFSLTGEYSKTAKEHSICKRCIASIEFKREIKRQQREMTASEDEIISGDYEE